MQERTCWLQALATSGALFVPPFGIVASLSPFRTNRMNCNMT